MTATTQCPECGNRHLQIVATTLVDVEYDDEGDHEVTDGPYGDIYFDDESEAICATNHGGCGYVGTLKEFFRADTPAKNVTNDVTKTL